MRLYPGISINGVQYLNGFRPLIATLDLWRPSTTTLYTVTRSLPLFTAGQIKMDQPHHINKINTTDLSKVLHGAHMAFGSHSLSLRTLSSPKGPTHIKGETWCQSNKIHHRYKWKERENVARELQAGPMWTAQFIKDRCFYDCNLLLGIKEVRSDRTKLDALRTWMAQPSDEAICKMIDWFICLACMQGVYDPRLTWSPFCCRELKLLNHVFTPQG